MRSRWAPVSKSRSSVNSRASLVDSIMARMVAISLEIIMLIRLV